MTYMILKTLHILSTAVWFGAGLSLSGDVRRTISRGRPHTDLLRDRAKRTGRLVFAGAVLTLLSGLALVFLMGGFANVTRGIHAGLGLTLVLFLMGIGLILPTWRRIDRILADEAGDLADADRLARRFAMYHGIEHLLWLAILAMMVVRF